MTLNFLRRNKTSRPSVLLFHNPKHNHSPRRPNNNRTDNIVRPQEEISPLLKKPTEDSLEDTVETSQRQRAMAHIESLVYEISISEKSDDLSRHRTKAISELLADKTHKDLSTSGALHELTDDKDGRTKPPLDVYELQTIAAMAKKLRAKGSHRLANKFHK